MSKAVLLNLPLLAKNTYSDCIKWYRNRWRDKSNDHCITSIADLNYVFFLDFLLNLKSLLMCGLERILVSFWPRNIFYGSNHGISRPSSHGRYASELPCNFDLYPEEFTLTSGCLL